MKGTDRLSADGVELVAGEGGPDPDLVLPAEAFCRLVYGRLDPEHTPAFSADAGVLDTLRGSSPAPSAGPQADAGGCGRRTARGSRPATRRARARIP
jgi:hypothetical protein